MRQLSWRDPGGFVVRHGNRILRAVAPEIVPDLQRLLGAAWFRKHVESGFLPETHWLDEPPAGYEHRAELRWLEHATIRFPCYPHEITASQLHEAAQLTLALARDALDDGWILKDASAWNVLFDRGRPVFCDILSFAPLGESGLWQAYAQFQRHFVIPLLVHRHLGTRTSRIFLSRRDGIEPEEARRMLTGLSAWRQPALEAVTLPVLFKSRAPSLRAPDTTPGRSAQSDPQLRKYLLMRTYNRLQSHINRLKPQIPANASKWSDYESGRDHYTEAALNAKRAFVSDALSDPAIRTVLDLGCNTGEFSLLAESLGKQVVAVDSDEQSLERLQQRLRERDLRIQAASLDLGRPTPAIGWLNQEIPAFLERSAGMFDCTLMLGLIHHLLVCERAPLAGVVELLDSIGSHTVVVEWIERRDPRFQQIAGMNAALYETLSREQFETAMTQSFVIQSRLELPGGTRTLYKCARRSTQ